MVKATGLPLLRVFLIGAGCSEKKGTTRGGEALGLVTGEKLFQWANKQVVKLMVT